KLLALCFLRNLQVYGTIFHMNQGNPFRLKALVDQWPDFNTVVICPQEQEMTDDFDHYTNNYQIYSKDLTNCQESLSTSDVINWKQHLQIQSSQPSLDKVIQNLATTKFVKVKQTQCILYVMPETARKLLPSLPETKNLPPGYSTPRMFKLSSLDVTHAALVNKLWHFGGNEKSQRFIERCIQNFLSFCLLGPNGTPVAWSLMDQTGEMRMGATLPEYRGQGLISYLMFAHTQTVENLGFPSYNHTDKANKIVQKICHNQHFISFPCGWNQWNCVPL
uniref:Glycine N-acyltransferase-like protein n=1 Tax=Catagonus wagneri TaxID=51154 RepID=A0A8C3W722_9CETA